MLDTKAKAPEWSRLRGFLPFLAVRHLQAGYRLLIAVQPFDDVVAGYTSHAGDKERNNKFHEVHLLPLPGFGWTTIVL